MLPEAMKVLLCNAPNSLTIEERARPTPSPGEALVRPRRIGICGTDYHIYEGKHPFLQYPRVMGHELAVEVVSAPAGSGLTPGEICAVNPYLSCGTCIACRAGKPNCCTSISVLGVHRDGGMAEYLTLPAANLIPGKGLTTEQCAAVEFLAIGAHAVRRGAVAKDERVLVIGAGPIGIGAALFARISGAQVWLLDLDAARVATAATIASGTALDVSAGIETAVKAATSGDGFDVVFDATGNQKSIEAGFAHVAAGGRYVLVSVVKETITFSDPDFHKREMTLIGSRNATSVDFERVMAAMRAGEVPMDRIITHRTSMVEAQSNLPRWAHEKHGLIKALIEI